MIQVLLSNLTYQEALAFNNAYQTGDLREAFRIAQKSVVDWDFDADLNDPEAFLDLKPSESGAVLRRLRDAIETFGETVDSSNVVVDVDNWTTRDVLKFSDAQTKRKWNVVEEMMPEVVSLKSGKFELPLNAPMGLTAQMAILEKYRKVLEGKN